MEIKTNQHQLSYGGKDKHRLNDLHTHTFVYIHKQFSSTKLTHKALVDPHSCCAAQ